MWAVYDIILYNVFYAFLISACKERKDVGESNVPGLSISRGLLNINQECLRHLTKKNIDKKKILL
jgi:hypothetical protein